MHLPLLRENAEATGELLDDALFERTQASEIDLGRNEIDSPIFRVLCFLDQFCDVQECLRGNAAAVEADTAGIQFRVDEGDGHAEIGGEECSGISTGAATDDCNVYIFRHKAFNHEGHEGTRRKSKSHFFV